MQAPRQRQPGGELITTDTVDRPIRLAGDAYVTFTAPFFPDGDPLVQRDGCTDPGGADLDGEGALLRSQLPLSVVMRGTLTFQQPSIDELTSFVGGEAWTEALRVDLDRCSPGTPTESVYDRIELVGMLFPDGYGSVAVTLRLPGGWERRRHDQTLDVVGVAGREALAERLRSALLPPLERMLRRCGAGELAVAVLPYFNLTYAGSTDHPTPGRSTLDDELRHLVYPDSAMPLASRSPWVDEYLYTGYAYHLLATRDPVPNLQKLTLLLLILNASYARLARFAAAADHALRSRANYTDVAWLARTERRLRSEYQSLITPTFSFDHHALKVRDAVLRSWDVSKLQARTDDLISMVRSAAEFRLAQDQARRIRRLNLFVFVLTALSIIPTVESLLAIFD
jgi:hypothetical protein